MVVKNTITYREITVAIGILVAMVIAFTLWIKTPGDKISASGSQPAMNIHTVSLRTAIIESLEDLSSKFYR